MEVWWLLIQKYSPTKNKNLIQWKWKKKFLASSWISIKSRTQQRIYKNPSYPLLKSYKITIRPKMVLTSQELQAPNKQLLRNKKDQTIEIKNLTMFRMNHSCHCYKHLVNNWIIKVRTIISILQISRNYLFRKVVLILLIESVLEVNQLTLEKLIMS